MRKGAVSEWLRRYATFAGMRTTPGTFSMMYTLGIVPPTTQKDRDLAHRTAAEEVGRYSVQQLAADPRPRSQIIADLAERNSTKTAHEKRVNQIHRAYEGR